MNFFNIAYACGGFTGEEIIIPILVFIVTDLILALVLSVVFLGIVSLFSKNREKGLRWMMKITAKFYITAVWSILIIFGVMAISGYLHQKSETERMESLGWHPMC